MGEHGGSDDERAETVHHVNTGIASPGDGEAVVFYDDEGRPVGEAVQDARPDPAWEPGQLP